MSSDPTALIASTFAYVSHLYCGGTTLYVLAQQRISDPQQLVHRNRHIFIVAALKLLGTINFVAFSSESTHNIPTVSGTLLQDSAAFLISIFAQSYLVSDRNHCCEPILTFNSFIVVISYSDVVNLF
jgi:hypothetical protein